MDTKQKTGIVGEYWSMYKLSLIEIRGYLLPPSFDYDIITDNDIRIEVKSARPTNNKKGHYEREVWNFMNQTRQYKSNNGKVLEYDVVKRNRDCDFFIFVCFNEDYTINCEYVIPKNIIEDRQIISIPVKISHSRYKEYKNRWDLIASYTNLEEE